MSGRFLAIPILISIVILTSGSIRFMEHENWKRFFKYIYVIIFIGTINPFSPIIMGKYNYLVNRKF